MEELKLKLKSEIENFKNLGYKFLNKEISVAEFKANSGGMGVYAQRDGKTFMIRLRIPSGILDYEHLKLIYAYTQKYNLKKIHFTTRQTIQLHDLSIDDVCEIMDDAIDNDIFTRGGGGNYPRNVSLSPLSGVEKGEAFDVTDFAVLTHKYLLRRIVNYKLPRKLKIAFSCSDADEANSSLNDLGFLAVVKDGKPYFKLYLAGGMGNNPAIAIEYDKLICPEDVLYHVEAFTQMFIAEGDYNNKSKARSRYIPRRMGIEKFIECYEGHLQKVKSENEFESVQAVVEQLSEPTHSLKQTDSIVHQKQSEMYCVLLHPLNGQFKVEYIEKLISFLDKLKNPSLRLSMNQDLYVRNLTAEQSEELAKLLPECINTKVGQSVSCIGVPTCQMGIEKSQALLRNILELLKERRAPITLLPAIHISGCTNSCSRHQVNELGFAGRKKKVDGVLEDVFELHVGGNHTELGKSVGVILTKQIPSFICDLAFELDRENMNFMQFMLDNQSDFEKLISKYILK